MPTPSGKTPGLFQRLKDWNQRRLVTSQPMSVTPVPDQIREESSEATYRASAEASPDDRSMLLPLSELPPPAPARRSWNWPLLCLAALGLVSGMGAAALLWLVSLPPPPECKQPASLTLDIERLYCAQQAIQTGGLPELIAGLKLLQQWNPEDALYAETQKLAEDWSKQVLAIAREKVLQSDLDGALAAIQHIPKTTPVYQQAQELADYWQTQWQEGEAIDAKAQDALKQQNWTLASEQVALLADFSNSYWNTQRANALAQQIGTEKQARQILARARNAAQGGQPQQFRAAITLGQEISSTTHTWQEGRQDLRKWSQTLVAIGTQRWEAGDRTGAVEALQAAPRSTNISELEDWVWFSHTYRLLNQSIPSQQPSYSWFPSGKQVWNLMEAIAAIGKVKPDSPFYQQAQTMQKNLQGQLHDLTQLHYATLLAELGQQSTLDLAIDQARLITPDRPQRVQAQTLIAYWYEQIERVEDQPYLDRATALAKSGAVPDLQAAIAEASLIPQGRALRREAQGWIATWRDQIEIIEDQPYLDRAWAFANAGNLAEAIEAAEMIHPGRALHGDAQSAIYSWQAQLIRNRQIAEDRPILDRAKAIANSGDLYNAIQVASQIGAGRVLYPEAQGLISTWDYQLNPPQSQPRSLDLDKLDKEDQSPETLDAAPNRSPDVFTWPDGSLSPYLPSPAPIPDRPSATPLPSGSQPAQPTIPLPNVTAPEILPLEPSPYPIEPSPVVVPPAPTPENSLPENLLPENSSPDSREPDPTVQSNSPNP